MKKLLGLLLVSISTFSQSVKYLSEGHEFSFGETVYMFGDNVKLRDEPNIESNVAVFIKIGEEVKILEKTTEKLLFEGIMSPWYKVQYKNKTGYVLGNLISLDNATIKNSTYLVALKREDAKLLLKTRVIKKGEKHYVENITELFTHEFSIKAFDNKGLDDLESVLKISYTGNLFGVDGGGIYLFFNGNELLKAIEYSIIEDGCLYFNKEEYIFPDDKGGKKGRIRYKKEIITVQDLETEWSETRITERYLKWNGNKIVPKIEKENR